MIIRKQVVGNHADALGDCEQDNWEPHNLEVKENDGLKREGET